MVYFVILFLVFCTCILAVINLHTPNFDKDSSLEIILHNHLTSLSLMKDMLM